MAPLRYIGPLALVIAVAACSDEETPIPYDSTTQNLYMQGTVSGFQLDVADAEPLEGEREYSPSRLCEVTASFDITVEGAIWSVDIELEDFDPESFGVGMYTVAGPDAPAAANQTGVEIRLDGDAAHHERSALGGYVEIKAYDSTAVQAGRSRRPGGRIVRCGLRDGLRCGRGGGGELPCRSQRHDAGR